MQQQSKIYLHFQQKWLNQFRPKSVSPSPTSSQQQTTQSTKQRKIVKNVRREENQNNFRSILDELNTMLAAHKRKFKIKRVRKKPTKSYSLALNLRNIGENLNLSIHSEIDESTQIHKISLGSQHELSQFSLTIAFDNKTCDVLINECEMDIFLCLDADNEVDVDFNDKDTLTIMKDLSQMIEDGDFDLLTTKLQLIGYFDDFHNYFAALLLSQTKEGGEGSLLKDIEMCMHTLPNIICFQRLLDGPSVVYAEQLMDCVLIKVKKPRIWQLLFVGLYPLKCVMNNSKITNDSKPKCSIYPIVKNQNKNNNEQNDENLLLFWFILRPSVIVPLEIAKKLFFECIGTEMSKNCENRMEVETENDKFSSHSSWIIDQTYSFHSMLIGDFQKKIQIFGDEEHLYNVKDGDFVGNGVKIDQIAIKNLNFVNAQSIKQSTLFFVVNVLKKWVIINQLYSQCFDLNVKKWKIVKDEKCEKICKKFEICLKDLNAPYLEIRNVENNENENKMDIDDDALRKEHKLPPKGVKNWFADFCVDNEHKISVKVKYFVDEKGNSKAMEIENVYAKKISDVMKKTNSVPITMSYVSKLFDGRYLRQKLKTQKDEDGDDMIDID